MRLVLDGRVGGRSIYQLLEEGKSLMRVPDEVRKCVMFAAYWNGKEFKFVGTASLIGVPVGASTDRHYLYVVTAKHIIERTESYSADGYIYFRANFREADAQWIKMDIDHWHFHPDDSTIDVAVHPIAWNSQFDHLWFSMNGFVTDDLVEKKNIGIGEEVFITGLFGRHSGVKKNLPIVRVGNIAAMLEEPITNTKMGSMEAYLVEARSIGGLSGSPVFVETSGVKRSSKGEVAVILTSGNTYYLLGLIHGHWNKRASEPDAIAIDENYAESIEQLNMGIVIVVPATKICEVLKQPELTKMREEAERKRADESSATMDALVESEPEKSFTKADFEDALKKVSQPKSDSETT